jgi:endonuclease-3 related protein
VIDLKGNEKVREVLLEVYRRLYDYFGPRRWWPADSAFEMIVGAILTQNVSWKGAVQAIDNLKQWGWLDLGELLEAPEGELAELIRPARYHNQKARKLKSFCRVVAEEFDSRLDDFLTQETGSLRRSLLAVYGIGPETADCIVLYAAERPVFIIDAYTHRIFNRLGYFGARVKYDEMQAFFVRNLPCDTKLFNEYHAQIDALGHRICLKRAPLCGGCPISVMCKAAETNAAAP